METSFEDSMRSTVINAVARFSVALIWIYHGVVPKLLFHDPGEQSMIREMGVSPHRLVSAMIVAGILEVIFGVWVLVRWHSPWPLRSTIGLMILALAAVAARSPGYLTHAFNPVSLNAAAVSLAIIGLMSGSNVPSADRCRRRPGQR